MKNYTLLGTSHVSPEPFDIVEDYREKAIKLTGSDICPPVLYKGYTIPTAKIGERNI